MKLEAAAKEAMDDPDFTKVLKNIQFPKRWMPSAELNEYTAKTIKGIEKVIAATQ